MPATLRAPARYHLGNKDLAYMCQISIPTDPIWVYPEGKNLALKFYNFAPITAPQTLQAFAVLAGVLETARRHSDYELVRAPGIWTCQRGSEEPTVVSISPGPSAPLLWGDVIETAVAVQIFLSTINCTTYVWINKNDEAKSYLGVFHLVASTSSVSTS